MAIFTTDLFPTAAPARGRGPFLPSPSPARRHALALAAALALAGPAVAQTPAATPVPTPAPTSAATSASAPAAAPTSTVDGARLDAVTITGRAPVATVGGFTQPLAVTPLAATVLSADELAERGITRLAEVTALDASVSDAYNTTGYWDYLTVRGYVLDQRFNYRRDGLPINAETAIHLGNKAGVEVLAGASGMQAGTSAPGGLVNYIVKRPERDLTQVSAGWREGGSFGAQADVSRRFGSERQLGLRLNVAAERLDTATEATRGRRQLFAAAGDFHLPGGALLEAELEHSLQRQPSVPGFSLLGDRIPTPADPRINLNNQTWSLPVVLRGDTASLRWTQPLGGDWKFIAHALTQRLKNDDRIAFPYGCTDTRGTADTADDLYYADRYCPDGSFDMYDYRSENERRRSDALDLGAQGRLDTAGLRHQLAAGLLFTRYRQRMQMQAYNWAGTGNVDGSGGGTADPRLTDQNTNRDERSSELYLRDALRLAPDWQAWLGLRHTRLHRESVRTNGSRPTAYDAAVTSPWLALSWEWAPQHIAYASWGRGMESEVAPNRARYTNRGEALLSRSRQVELGLKGSRAGLDWRTALFDIRRPQTASVGSDCSSDTPGNTCTFVIDGIARHRGLEGRIDQTLGAWRLGASALLLQARREGSADTTLNGKRPPNVPERNLKGYATWNVAALPGLSLTGAVVHEGDRTLTPYDSSLRIPAWARLDTSARWQQAWGERRLTWSAGIDNLTNRRAWREAPYQFEHIYLFPMAGRTARLSVTADL